MSDEKWEPWMTASIVLIERDGVVPVSARTLTALISYALAEPTSTVSQRLRDEAVSEAHDAICAALAPPVPQQPDCEAFDDSLVAMSEEAGWRDPLPRCTLERGHPGLWHSSEDVDGRILAQWRGPHNAALTPPVPQEDPQ